MAIVFNDPYIAFYSNAKVHVRLTDSNNAENFNDSLFFNHNYRL